MANTKPRVSEDVRENITRAIDSINDATNALEEENVNVPDDAALMYLFWSAQEDLQRAHANLLAFLQKV